MRIYDSQSNPHDFCKRCFPSERDAYEIFADSGDAPDGRGNCFEYDAEAPWFYDEPDHGYDCENCGIKLTPKNSF